MRSNIAATHSQTSYLSSFRSGAIGSIQNVVSGDADNVRRFPFDSAEKRFHLLLLSS
jgi:hypothetical protein